MSSTNKLPWLGSVLIIASLFLPYIEILWASDTGFDIIGDWEIWMNKMGINDGVDGYTFDEYSTTTLMLIFSPFVFSLSGLVSAIVLLLKKSPRIVGGLHLTFVIIFGICSVVSPVEVFEILSLTDIVGGGFYLGAFSSILLLIHTNK